MADHFTSLAYEASHQSIHKELPVNPPRAAISIHHLSTSLRNFATVGMDENPIDWLTAGPTVSQPISVRGAKNARRSCLSINALKGVFCEAKENVLR